MELVATAIIFLAFLGESTFGFGGGMTAIPVLSSLYGVKYAVTLTLVFQTLMGLMTLVVFKDVYKKHMLLVCISLAIGCIAGTYALAYFDELVLRYLLAGSIVLYLCKTLFCTSARIASATTRFGTVVLYVLAGLFQGMIGVGTPFMIVHLSEIKLTKKAFRATVIFYLFIIQLLRIVPSIESGLLTKQIFSQSLTILPFFCFALLCGHFLHHRLSETWYRRAVLSILTLSMFSLLR